MLMRIDLSKCKINILLVPYVIMLTGCIYSLFSSTSRDIVYSQKAGEAWGYQVIWLVLYLTLIFNILRRAKFVAALVFDSWLLLALLISALLSYLVNGVDAFTLVKFGMYVMTILFAAWITTIDDVDEVFDSLFQIGVFVLVLHFVAYPLLWNVSYDSLNRTTVIGTAIYGGLFGHKQLAGAYFGLNLLVCIARFFSTDKRSAVIFLTIPLNLFALLMTGSTGPLLSVVVAIAAAVGLQLLIARRSDIATVYWMLAALGAVLISAIGIGGIFQLVGRDAAWTGRDFYFSVWPTFFLERPWLGYGYAGFFTGLPDAPAMRLWALTPWQQHVGTFESSYLEAGLQFGAIGGVFFALILFKAIVNAIRFAGVTESRYRIGPLLLLTFVIVASISDTELVMHNHIFVVIMFWAYFGLAQAFSRTRVRRDRIRIEAAVPAGRSFNERR